MGGRAMKPASRRAARGARVAQGAHDRARSARSLMVQRGPVQRRDRRPPRRRRGVRPDEGERRRGRRSGGELCQDWHRRGGAILVEQPGYFCDWCLYKACDVCNLASPPAAGASSECVATQTGTTGRASSAGLGPPARPGFLPKPHFFCDWAAACGCAPRRRRRPSVSRRKQGTTGRRRAVQDWCTDPSKHETDFVQPRYFCDWLLQGVRGVRTHGAGDRRCVPRKRGRRVRRRAVPRLVHRPVEARDRLRPPNRASSAIGATARRATCAPTAAPATVEECVPTQQGRRVRRRAVPRLVHRPVEARHRLPDRPAALLLRLVLLQGVRRVRTHGGAGD